MVIFLSHHSKIDNHMEEYPKTVFLFFDFLILLLPFFKLEFTDQRTGKFRISLMIDDI
jgi:hypothetical protein